jgi:hypothetical protein
LGHGCKNLLVLWVWPKIGLIAHIATGVIGLLETALSALTDKDKIMTKSYTTDEVRHALISDLGTEDELTSVANRIAKERAPSKETKIYAGLLVSGINASGIDESVMVGMFANNNKEIAGRIIFGYPLDPSRQQAALSQLAAYLYAYFGDHNLTFQVGFREQSADGSFADHFAVAGTILKSTPGSWERSFRIKEVHEAP